MRQLTIFILIIFLTISSCTERREVKLTDKDLVINSRLYSPDKKHVIYDYAFDIGALGYSNSSYAIVKTSDTAGIINENEFDRSKQTPYDYYILDKWLDNNTLQVMIDEGHYIRQGVAVDITPFKVGNIEIKVIIRDPTNGFHPIIEHFSVSPDGKKLLVAYKYSGASEINIAALNLTDTLPTLGNIFTCNQTEENPILFGKWADDNEIIIIVKEEEKQYFQSQLNQQNKFKVKIIGEKYISKYSGIQGGWYNKILHPNDNQTKEKLQNNCSITKAIIKDCYGWGDSYYTHLLNFFYEYEVNGAFYKSYFRATQEKCKLQKGDSLEIIYNKTQPIIHKPKEYNSR